MKGLVLLEQVVIAAVLGCAPVLIAPGSGDPMGLAGVGLMLPFFASPGNISYLELDSPVGDNSMKKPPVPRDRGVTARLWSGSEENRFESGGAIEK